MGGAMPTYEDECKPAAQQTRTEMPLAPGEK